MARLSRLDTATKFHVDLAWWEQRGRDFRAEMLEGLCPECRSLYPETEIRLVDRVDPDTGQVIRFDAAWDCLIDQCVENGQFLDRAMPVTRLIFRAFIASGNRPLTPVEIYGLVRKGNPQAILKELLHGSIDEYGIVPEGA